MCKSNLGKISLSLNYINSFQFVVRVKVGSQYGACASVTTGSAIETNGSMYAYVRIEISDIRVHAPICFYSTSGCDASAHAILRTHL